MQFEKELKDREIKFNYERLRSLEREVELLNLVRNERKREEINILQMRQHSRSHKSMDSTAATKKFQTRFENEEEKFCEGCLIY
jgi:predicted HTH domain antitoxin